MDVLHEYLRSARQVMLWKLEGLTDYDVRRPMVPTGTNLLGLLRHVGSVETGYFGFVFGRPFPEPLPWRQDGEPNGEMWVRADETTQSVVAFCRRAWAHADVTIDTLPVDAEGEVPWWPEGQRRISFLRALVHVLADIQRLAGHADILREHVDGAVGEDRRWPNVWPGDEAWWTSYRNKIDDAALRAARPAT